MRESRVGSEAHKKNDKQDTGSFSFLRPSSRGRLTLRVSHALALDLKNAKDYHVCPAGYLDLVILFRRK